MVAQFGHSGSKRRGVLGALALGAPLSLALVLAHPAQAEQIGLSDDDAIVLTPTAAYSLDLSSAELTEIATLSDDGSIAGQRGGFPAVEASPGDDALFAIDQDTGGDQLFRVEYPAGSSSRIGSPLVGQAVHGIARTNDGTTFVTVSFDDGSGTTSNQLATLDLSDRKVTTIGPTTAGDTSVLITALFALDGELYGFGFLDTDTLYTIDTSTGALSEVDTFVSSLSGVFVAGADTSADGTVYIVTTNGDATSWLSTTDLASTTEVGQITGGAAENLAIATLLDSERPEPEPEPETEPETEPEPEPETEPEPEPAPRSDNSASNGDDHQGEADQEAPAAEPTPAISAPAPTPVEAEIAPEPATDSETVGESRQAPPEPQPGPEAFAPVLPTSPAEQPETQLSLAAVSVAIAVVSLLAVFVAVLIITQARAHSERPRH